MRAQDLIKMKNTDIRTVSRDELVDIDTVKINVNNTPEQKVNEYINQIKNPYCFLCGGYVVKLEYSDEGRTIEDCFIKMIESLL